MQTFHIIVYGCQMNYSDAARIRAVLSNCGRVQVDNKEQADVVILDTCSVRQKSEDKVRGLLTEIRKDQKVWLTGCMIQHNLNLKKTKTSKSKKYPQGNFTGKVRTQDPFLVGLEEMDEDKRLQTLLKAYALGQQEKSEDLLYINHAFDPLFKQMHNSFPQVELFFRIDDVGMLPFVMNQLGYDVQADLEVSNEYMSIIPRAANMLKQDATKTAYIPISTGCSQFCAYCIVPYARGLEKNRAVDDILHEVDVQLANGAEEIVLLGQIVNKHPDFYQILKTVSEKPGVKWLRYTSPYPTYYDANIFALHQDMDNICPHIHMPVQSGSDAVLKKMFRGYTVEQYKEFVDGIRGLSREISITSDVIVGFCDETEEDFQQTLELVEYSGFDMVYMGIYSPRPGTYGARKYEDNVAIEVKKDRRARINAVLTDVSTASNEKELGRDYEIMVREISDTTFSGYTEHMKNVVVHVDGTLPDGVAVGEFTQVKILGTKPFTLYGEVT